MDTTSLTPERIHQLARISYKILGYSLETQPDGQVSVNCSPRTADLMNVFQQLLIEELKDS